MSNNRWKIYHNPRCSKSRETLKLLHDQNIDPEIIEYLNTPPSEDELRELLSMLKIKPSELLRKKEKVIREEALDITNEERLVALMHQHPILIERPIIVKGGRAVLGRPPENIEQLV